MWLIWFVVSSRDSSSLANLQNEPTGSGTYKDLVCEGGEKAIIFLPYLALLTGPPCVLAHSVAVDIPSPILFIPCGGTACCPWSLIWDPCSSLHPWLPLCLLVLTTHWLGELRAGGYFLFGVPRRGHPTGCRLRCVVAWGPLPDGSRHAAPGDAVHTPRRPGGRCCPSLAWHGSASAPLPCLRVRAAHRRHRGSCGTVAEDAVSARFCRLPSASLTRSLERVSSLSLAFGHFTPSSFSLPDCLQRTDFFIFRNVSLILRNWTFSTNHE